MTHKYSHSAISASRTAIAAHAYSQLLPPVYDGDVGDLLGAAGLDSCSDGILNPRKKGPAEAGPFL